MTTDSAAYLTQLHQLIDQHFGLEDVRQLCFELGIKYDDLRGEGLSARVRELILLMGRTGRLPDLVAKAQEHRSYISWPPVPDDLQLPSDTEPFPPPVVKPRLRFEPETVPIPAGSFIMGSDDHRPEEAPRHTVELPAYHIGIYPVTNEQYAQFVEKTGRVVESTLLWDGNLPPDDELGHPVTGITWYEALEYCQWLSELTERHYTLPSEAQWEKAARGPGSRIYPWGDDWDPERCNDDPGKIIPVTAYPAQSDYGCFDMVGNGREWTTTLWGKAPSAPDGKYAYPWADDGRDDISRPQTIRRIYRGGRAKEPHGFRCSARGDYLPGKPGPRRNRHGFRIVLLSN